MKFALELERIYAHPREKVWQALVDGPAVAQWLMPNDLVAEPGRTFTMECPDGAGGVHRYACRVLEVVPPERLVWSWQLPASDGGGSCTVVFHLETVPAGTRLTVRHSGDIAPATADKFRGGWPERLTVLERVLP